MSDDDLPGPPVVDRHAAVLRHLCARLEAIGTPAAAMVMDAVGTTITEHLEAVDAAFAFVEAAETAATAH